MVVVAARSLVSTRRLGFPWNWGALTCVGERRFWLGEKMKLVFMSNTGRDHAFVSNVLRPLPPATWNSSTPQVRKTPRCPRSWVNFSVSPLSQMFS
jgi:hypothetical protein